MRKIISLGLLALLFSLFSGQVFAGKVQLCEEQKEELQAYGLYGLCNAYWNAEEGTAQDQILINYNDLAELVGGPPMPGTETPCPCWNSDQVLDAMCSATFDGVDVISGIVEAVYFYPPNVTFLTAPTIYDDGPPGCVYDTFPVALITHTLAVDSEAYISCQVDLATMEALLPLDETERNTLCSSN